MADVTADEQVVLDWIKAQKRLEALRAEKQAHQDAIALLNPDIQDLANVVAGLRARIKVL